MTASSLVFFAGLFLAVSASDYVTYVPGNINVIVSAPHGGNLDILGCTGTRINGCMRNGKCVFNAILDSTCISESKDCSVNPRADSYTSTIAELVTGHLTTSIGKPYMVIMRAHRKYIDANREIGEACMGCPECEAVYNEYHAKVAEAVAAVKRGILFDIHGQAHGRNSTEMGYRVTKWWIERYVNEGGKAIDKPTTVAQLAVDSGVSVTDLIMGERSIGARLETEGFAALPSTTLPIQNSPKYSYFQGGYTVDKYNSAKLDAIQIEAPGEVRVKGGAMRAAYSRGLASAMTYFYYDFRYDTKNAPTV